MCTGGDDTRLAITHNRGQETVSVIDIIALCILILVWIEDIAVRQFVGRYGILIQWPVVNFKLVQSRKVVVTLLTLPFED